jgi:hypothetical protein
VRLLPVGQYQTQVFHCVRFSGDHLPVNSDMEFSPFRGAAYLCRLAGTRGVGLPGTVHVDLLGSAQSSNTA